MTAINAVTDYAARGRRRRHHPQLAAGERALGRRCATAWPAAWQAADRRSRRQGDRADLRGPHLHRRRRHHRVRRRARRAPACSTCRTRWRARPSRWSPPSTARRSAAGWRSRSALPLPRRRAVGALRPAGGEPRPAARRRRHPAPAAHRRRREGAGDDDLRPARAGQGSAWRWAWSTRSCEEGKLREGAIAFARKVVAENRPLKKVRDINDKVEAATRPPGDLRRLPQGQRPQVPRLPGARSTTSAASRRR